MSANAKKSAEIKSVDPVWEAVRAGARQIVDAEPSLANMVISAILNHDSFEAGPGASAGGAARP